MIKELLATEQRTTIERWCRDRARAVLTPSGETICRVLGELTMVVRLNDLSIAPHLALDGYWEMWLSMCMAKRIKPGWCCLDVGANFGYYTLLMATLTGEKVFAWEPMVELSIMLESSARLSSLEHLVQTVPFAASDDASSRTIFRERNDWGGASIPPSSSTPKGEGRAVTCSRLDAFENRIDFIKIDTNGHEPETWAGMKGILARGEPKAMLMEWTPHLYANPGEFLDEIRGQGFRVHLVDGAGELQDPVGDITTIEGHLDLWLDR